MRVVIITQYFPPDPPSWIPGGLARELLARGHEVRVLTTFPHYESGRVADGFSQRLHHVERDGNLIVRRVPLFASHSTNAVARIANYVSVATSMRLARRFVKGVDVAYVYATPMTVADPARAWARSMKIPFVLHVQDMWPESVTGSGFLPTWAEQIARVPLDWWLRRVYQRAAATVAIAPSMREMLIERGVPADRATTIFNWSDDADAATARTQPEPSTAGLSLVYAGNLGRMQDLETIVQAFARVQDLPNVTLRIAGSGVLERELRSMVDSLGVRGVEFVGRINATEVAELYARSDFQFVTLKDLPIFDGTIPSKFQAGIANGLPAISTVRGDLRGLIEQNGLGFTADAENADSLAAAIRRAYGTSHQERKAYRFRARKYYETTMSKKAAVDDIEKLLQSAALETKR
ncbi:glycosyltransferase WbuB [Microbacterium esteraromaticum]|nr:glycosyltransferase WbuB [Microbacterium esteraromaticum]